MKRAFILCAGQGVRWTNPETRGVLKQLMPFGGVPLLQRTAAQIERLFGESRSPVEIVVVYRDYDIRDATPFPAHTFFPIEAGQVVQTLASTAPLWKERNLVLLGDVIYTDEALSQIVNTPEQVTFFGTRHEIFGLSFTPHVAFWDALNRVCFDAELGGAGKLNTLYNAYLRTPLLSQERGAYFVEIKDKTCDLDVWDDYEAALRNWGFVS